MDMDQEKLLMMTDVREVWLFVRRNIRLVVIITVLVTVFAVLLSLVLPAHYAGKTSIMLDARRTRVSDIESVVSSLPADTPAIRSEIDVICSRAVIDRVIDELSLMNDPSFNRSLRGFAWFSRLFASHKPEAKERRTSDDRTRVATLLRKHLDAQNDGRSFIIHISYDDLDPVRAARIANAFADQYLVDQLEVKFDTTQRANTWLSKRLDALRNDVSSAEKAVEDFKSANNLVGVGEETITQKQLGTINAQLLEARASRSQTEARLNSVKGLSAEEVETSSTVLTSLLIQELKKQEAEVRRKEADLSTRYGDRHPMIINTRNELRSIRDKVKEEINKIIAGFQNDYNIANAKVESLEKDLATLEAQTSTGNQAMVTLRQLQREAAANRSLYEGFLNRSKQVAESQDLQVADARIIARAEVPVKPYFPDTFIFMIMGIVLGGIGGFVTALILEYLDRGIRALQFVEKNYKVPGLGMVPLAETAEGQLPTDYVLEKPLSAYAEAIRSVRTAIHFSNVDNPPKVIVITSSLPNEGKTVFSTSFARILAKSGNKVLLIDSDMRRPRLHSLLNLDKNKPDLARVLANEASFEEAIQKDVSGADIIIARAKTPNPQDLLSSKQMEKLLSTARQNYDTIILDAPPVMAVADAALTAKLADATVYIIRWASTPREVVAEGLRHFTNFNIKVAGVVLTQVNLQEQKQYGYGDYGYYYGHYKDYYTN